VVFGKNRFEIEPLAGTLRYNYLFQLSSLGVPEGQPTLRTPCSVTISQKVQAGLPKNSWQAGLERKIIYLYLVRSTASVRRSR
jgi:hypothetical protein